MKKQPNNKFDLLIEKLIEGFTTIPNFDITQKDELANKLFNTVSYRIAELTTYKELVIRHYVPETNKAIHISKNEFRNSKYRNLLNIKEIDFQETLYETIRLAYVGLFHKIENFTNDVLEMTSEVFSEFYVDKISLNNWTKEKFEFQIKDWQQFKLIHRINWIANCVKHRDGFPTKSPKPIEFEYADENIRLQLSVNDFKNDCEILLPFYPIYIQLMFLFAQHKMFSQESFEHFEDKDFVKEQNDKLENLGIQLKLLVKQLKKI
ncbi:hypothetical protein [Kaistella faecalis]|uniref:hypothetical protein n=1 Tax=Kaistella faecalis TaxID=2852098 RepID=UPI001C480303|nr:hypothetical protein [Chryseobacterium faecale]UFK97751.1 hypothetical protein LL667_12435 [Chryseobacterium faecale]